MSKLSTHVYPANSNITFLTNYRKAVDQGSLLFHSLCQSPILGMSGKSRLGVGGEGEQEAPVRTGYNYAMKPGCQDSALSWGGPKTNLQTPLHMAMWWLKN